MKQEKNKITHHSSASWLNRPITPANIRVGRGMLGD